MNMHVFDVLENSYFKGNSEVPLMTKLRMRKDVQLLDYCSIP